MTGTITWGPPERSWGWIRGDEDEAQYFFHVSAALGLVQEGDRVTFEPQEHARGPRAVDVRPLDGRPPAAAPPRPRAGRVVERSLILGDDGRHYRYGPEDTLGVAARVGDRVDFELVGRTGRGHVVDVRRVLS